MVFISSKLRFTISCFLAGTLTQFYPTSVFSQASVPSFPFPAHCIYFPGVIKPNNISRAQMEESVMRFYDNWKSLYIKEVPHEFIKHGSASQWYAYAQDKNNADQLATSEQQGYGMIITALMAGHDMAAQQIFNGLFAYVKAHPSNKSKDLMAWQQNKKFVDTDSASAAPDGDMDIAYSLLLADAQWGSIGVIDYLEAAKKILSAVCSNEINIDSYTILLAPEDKDTSGINHYYYERTSDFMPAHFKIFAGVMKEDSMLWKKLIDENYALFESIQRNYSRTTGLVPDVIENVNTANPLPAKRKVLDERTRQNAYSYNACRVPWRLASDYVLNGDARAKKFLDPENKWIIANTTGIPGHIAPGYKLNGKFLESHPDFDNFDAMPFLAPFAVSAMIDSGNQSWLNKLWDFMLSRDCSKYDSYDNTIKMFCMIIISGNYWSPKK